MRLRTTMASQNERLVNEHYETFDLCCEEVLKVQGYYYYFYDEIVINIQLYIVELKDIRIICLPTFFCVYIYTRSFVLF